MSKKKKEKKEKKAKKAAQKQAKKNKAASLERAMTTAPAVSQALVVAATLPVEPVG